MLANVPIKDNAVSFRSGPIVRAGRRSREGCWHSLVRSRPWGAAPRAVIRSRRRGRGRRVDDERDREYSRAPEVTDV